MVPASQGSLHASDLNRYTESVFNSMINSQSNLKNPLPPTVDLKPPLITDH
ncbi:hypothetical protein O53_1478 [Microcystis aeruginosa TAIHU98]|uniref:Uncharacterized protein n=1 Tax=Microcystis aeruginosa TAIHU98 TaxID=1134457 RepID=L7EEZ9_MICAE|nr:hypothetical protein O53_1478 [Microcystis aeruginosa TAIHU98]ODV36971.1 hypothetical protein BFG60_3626 [Microcystis aeruginosa NIES-98]